MRMTWLIFLTMVCVSWSLVRITTVLGNEPAAANSEGATAKSPAAEPGQKGYSLEAARDRAKVMHDVYAATLEVLHERYFHNLRAIVPARAIEDVFSTIKQESKVEARWISVNMKPMSITHAPKSEFEKRAAKEIAAGKSHFEVVEEGYYRRAGAIPLGNSCISCHDGFFKDPPKSPKFEGLAITVPIHKSNPGESK